MKSSPPAFSLPEVALALLDASLGFAVATFGIDETTVMDMALPSNG
ncbi:hypothetical protein [uncultured Propionivibrio sp.]|nr:hypothetical protein [uncultured Propionivibrio sp.]